MLAARENVVGKGYIRADENVVFDSNPVPQLYAGFDRDTVTYDDIVFDQTMRADIAVGADLSAGKHDGELPDAGVEANVRGLGVGEGV